MKMRVFVAFAWLCGALFAFSTTSFSAASPYIYRLPLPITSLDFSDLDLRDSQNRPIKSAAMLEMTKSLFISGLNQMLMNDLTPTRKTLLLWLSRFWDTSNGLFQSCCQRIKADLQSWFNNKKVLKIILVNFQFYFDSLSKQSSYARREFSSRFLVLLAPLLSSIYLLC